MGSVYVIKDTNKKYPVKILNVLDKSGTVRKSVLRIALYAFLIALAAAMLLPFAWMISASLKMETEVYDMPIKWFPSKIMWSNYVETWQRVPFLKYYINTIIVSVSVTVMQVMTCSLAAYTFSKINFPERDTLFLGYLATMMIPYSVTMIPQFFVIRSLGLMDSLLSVILLNAFSPFGVFLFRQFFLSIPEGLSESVRMDGGSEFVIYRRIIMPLAKPAVASLVIFTFIYSWNDFLGPLIYLSSDSNKTLQLGMRAFQTMYNQDFALLMAAAVSALVPAILVFLAAQDYFIEGITLSGIKG